MEPRKRRYLFGGIAAALVLAASAVVYAHAGRGMHGMHGGMDFDELTAHFEVHVEHVLKQVDATPEQQAQIKAIVESAAKDIGDLREMHGPAHRELHEIFMAPTIDRARLENLRASHVQALDAASKRCATALADASEVLTPEQRAQLGEKMAKRMH